MDYYLPTTLKILNAYDRMDSTGIAGDNISTTKAKVERMMDTITQAFDKQLDALFGEEGPGHLHRYHCDGEPAGPGGAGGNDYGGLI